MRSIERNPLSLARPYTDWFDPECTRMVIAVTANAGTSTRMCLASRGCKRPAPPVVVARCERLEWTLAQKIIMASVHTDIVIYLSQSHTVCGTRAALSSPLSQGDLRSTCWSRAGSHVHRYGYLGTLVVTDVALLLG